ncbi:Uncharacterised protein [Clostridioides difficile]|uniref:hypothetical protein n=1 Tax=Clostridioides difficile TaxID=1496 RepID=UPI0010283F2B|nr:hypothetical protein [Clostridioides difficile]VFC52114.1 Uncharacterised protein [Clostridioides difficile]VHX71092.1 Uncharacterised protein [Clostridioides difficile]HBE9443384.1 hypothetical protein [Clostridioides difficile]
MKIRKRGFISIECVISIAILYVAVYLVSTPLYSCYSFVSRNISDRKMLSTAKKYIEDEKYRIQNSKYELIENKIEKNYINGYEISSRVEQILDYYQCYEINIEIKNEFKKLRFNSYVTRK